MTTFNLTFKAVHMWEIKIGNFINYGIYGRSFKIGEVYKVLNAHHTASFYARDVVNHAEWRVFVDGIILKLIIRTS